MYERILVAIDGSEPSEQALTEAIAVASLTKAQLRLLHVVDELSFVLGAGFGVAGAGYSEGYSRELVDTLQENGRLLLERAEKRVREAGLECTGLLRNSFDGALADQVVAQAKSWPASLIVLGSHGRRGMARLFLGSDAETILRMAPVPVLLVRKGQTS
ncbi:MAG: universal stress protein [Paucibacter sp.]|nr:universal stress protein [Roseateles sp.]